MNLLSKKSSTWQIIYYNNILICWILGARFFLKLEKTPIFIYTFR